MDSSLDFGGQRLLALWHLRLTVVGLASPAQGNLPCVVRFFAVVVLVAKCKTNAQAGG